MRKTHLCVCVLDVNNRVGNNLKNLLEWGLKKAQIRQPETNSGSLNQEDAEVPNHVVPNQIDSRNPSKLK